MKQCRQNQASTDDRLLGLLGPYHQHAIDTFNNCSWGATHRSLTDTGGATTLEVPACHIPLPDLPNQLSPLSTEGPCPVSSLTKFHQLNQSVEFKEPMTATWSFDHPTIYHSLHLRLAIANDLFLVIRVASIDQKVFVMQLGINPTPIT
jgi:hypothetical protein